MKVSLCFRNFLCFFLLFFRNPVSPLLDCALHDIDESSMIIKVMTSSRVMSRIKLAGTPFSNYNCMIRIKPLQHIIRAWPGFAKSRILSQWKCKQGLLAASVSRGTLIVVREALAAEEAMLPKYDFLHHASCCIPLHILPVLRKPHNFERARGFFQSMSSSVTIQIAQAASWSFKTSLSLRLHVLRRRGETPPGAN